MSPNSSSLLFPHLTLFQNKLDVWTGFTRSARQEALIIWDELVTSHVAQFLLVSSYLCEEEFARRAKCKLELRNGEEESAN